MVAIKSWSGDRKGMSESALNRGGNNYFAEKIIVLRKGGGIKITQPWFCLVRIGHRERHRQGLKILLVCLAAINTLGISSVPLQIYVKLKGPKVLFIPATGDAPATKVLGKSHNSLFTILKSLNSAIPNLTADLGRRFCFQKRGKYSFFYFFI